MRIDGLRWKGNVRVVLGLSLLMTALLGGCSSATDGTDVKLISVAEGEELVQGKGQLLKFGGKTKGVWVDHRTEAEFKAGHIPGALSMPYEHLADDKKLLEGYDAIIVYGDDYNDHKAEAFSKRLIEWGLGNVRTLHGGLRAWKDAGNQVEVSK